MKSVILLIIAYITCIGCVSSLNVKVEVADREMVKSAAMRELSPDFNTTIQNIDQFINYKHQLINDIVEYYKQRDNVEMENNNLMKETTDVFNNKYGKSYDNINNLNQKLKNQYAKKDLINAYYTIGEIEKSIDSIKQNLATFDPKNGTKISTFLKTKINTTKVFNLSEDIQKNSKRLRFHLLGDPLTSFVSKDDNRDIWKSTFNETNSTNVFGNSDIAIILRTNPPDDELKSGDYNNNFTIKGVRLDSDDAINATFNVMSQAVNMISTVYGAPKFNTNNSTENPTPEQTNEIIGLATSTEDYNINEKKLNTLKKLLINFIEYENIEKKKGDDLKNSLLRINEYWMSIKNEINK